MHTAPYSMGIGISFLGVKAAGCEFGHLPQSSAEVKNASVLPPPPYAFMVRTLTTLSFNFQAYY